MPKLIKYALIVQFPIFSFIAIRSMEKPTNISKLNTKFILLRRALKNNNDALAANLALSIPPDLVDPFGRSALHYVDTAPAVRLLLGSGGNINALDSSHQTPLDRALAQNRREAVCELTRWGGLMANQASTLLHYAADHGNILMIKALLRIRRCRWLLNAQDAEGYTPLHNALIEGHDEAAELLLRAGANATLENHLGITAFDMIAGIGNLELIRLMRQTNLYTQDTNCRGAQVASGAQS